MNTLKGYYGDLQKWEEVEPVELVASWPPKLVDDLKSQWIEAVRASAVYDKPCPIRAGSSNQSIGNQVEEFLIRTLSPHWKSAVLERCSGAGYPDRQMRISDVLLALEMKATSDWNPMDSNRRVLTSSTLKLRTKFKAPIYHLLCTSFYRIEGDSASIHNIRLDFMEPDTLVNVRLEASVSHKLLSNSSHATLLI